MKQSKKDSIVIGFALFSMFFGAGNLVFPPYLGLEAGPSWTLGFLCYYIADIGLAIFTLFVILKCGNSAGITAGLGKIPATIMMCVVILCIGPMVAIPRTAATTYEMAIEPIFGKSSSIAFSIIFFLLIFILCIRESAVLDIVGKFLTPFLLVGLCLLIIKGIVNPIGEIAVAPRIDAVAQKGIKAGYQTLDVLAAMVFGVLILKTTEEKGYVGKKEKNKIVASAGCIAGIGLLFAYMGLTYLGATASGYYGAHMNRSTLVLFIVRNLLGQSGVIIFAIIVALACTTTALALVSSSASYFAELFSGKISYKMLVAMICAVSAVFSNIGLDTIVAIASPVLDVVYPPILVMIVITFFSKAEHKKAHRVLRAAVIGAMLASIFITANEHGMPWDFLTKLPLYSVGFGWVVPAIFCGFLGWIWPDLSKKEKV